MLSAPHTGIKLIELQTLSKRLIYFTIDFLNYTINIFYGQDQKEMEHQKAVAV